MIKAVLFDMDGVIVDSEPFWDEAENIAFAKVGFTTSSEERRLTQGMSIDQVVDFWYLRKPWKSLSKKQVAEIVRDNLLRIEREKSQFKPGAKEGLSFIKNKKVKTAISSSSLMVLIQTVIKALGIENYFDLLYSAEFEKYGKPHPGIYISSAEKLGVIPEECLVIEDSINGLLSAKSARMKCVCVPEKQLLNDQRFSLADLVLPSLSELSEDAWQKLNI